MGSGEAAVERTRELPPGSAPAAGGPSGWTATGQERPVFLDERGRRRRWVLAGGLAGTIAMGAWLAALIAGAVGFASLPSLSGGAAIPTSRPPPRHLAPHTLPAAVAASPHRRTLLELRTRPPAHRLGTSGRAEVISYAAPPRQVLTVGRG